MKYSELERRLRRSGCYIIDNGNHPIWYSPITKKKFQTGHHGTQEVKIGTLRKIIKDSGIKL